MIYGQISNIVNLMFESISQLWVGRQTLTPAQADAISVRITRAELHCEQNEITDPYTRAAVLMEYLAGLGSDVIPTNREKYIMMMGLMYLKTNKIELPANITLWKLSKDVCDCKLIYSHVARVLLALHKGN